MDLWEFSLFSFSLNTDTPPPPYSQFAMERLKTEGEFYMHYNVPWARWKSMASSRRVLYEWEKDREWKYLYKHTK